MLNSMFDFLCRKLNNDCAEQIVLMVHAPRIQAAWRGYVTRHARYPEGGRVHASKVPEWVARSQSGKYSSNVLPPTYMYCFPEGNVNALLRFCAALRPGVYDFHIKILHGSQPDGPASYIDERVTVLPSGPAFHHSLKGMDILVSAHAIYYGSTTCFICIGKACRV